MQVILSNKVQCKHCKQTIESKHRHDFVTCKCKTVSVDGGTDYLKRSFKKDGDYIEKSEIIEVPSYRNEQVTLSMLRRRASMEPVNIAYLCNKYLEALLQIKEVGDKKSKAIVQEVFDVKE